MSNCFEGEEIDFKELQSPEKKAFMDSLFSFIGGGLGQGPSMPQGNMPINAPNDPNTALGMNMFREMGGQSPDYVPWQAPQTWNNAWNPQWPSFPPYVPQYETESVDKEKKNYGDDRGSRSKHPNKSGDREDRQIDKNPGR